MYVLYVFSDAQKGDLIKTIQKVPGGGGPVLMYVDQLALKEGFDSSQKQMKVRALLSQYIHTIQIYYHAGSSMNIQQWLLSETMLELFAYIHTYFYTYTTYYIYTYIHT